MSGPSMTPHGEVGGPLTSEQVAIRDRCIAEAGRIYGGILADPVRGAQIRAGRERLAAERATAESTAAGGRQVNTHARAVSTDTRRSA